MPNVEILFPAAPGIRCSLVKLYPSQPPARRRALAMRAAFGLPFGQLLRHTPDPIGDLVEDRYDRLLEALYEDAEVRTT